MRTEREREEGRRGDREWGGKEGEGEGELAVNYSFHSNPTLCYGGSCSRWLCNNLHRISSILRWK